MPDVTMGLTSVTFVNNVSYYIQELGLFEYIICLTKLHKEVHRDYGLDVTVIKTHRECVTWCFV